MVDAVVATAVSWGAAGLEYLRVDRHAEAIAALEQALRRLPGSAGIDAAEGALLQAEWTAACMSARLELGALDEAEPTLRAELAKIGAAPQPQSPSAQSRRRAAEADLQMALARVLAKTGRLSEARATLQSCLAQLDGLPVPLQLARAEFQLAGTLALCGDLAAALENWQRAADRIAPGEMQVHVVLRARIAMNRGIALADLGRHGAAATAMQEALALFEGLALTGRVGASAELARALRNHGFALGRAGRHEEAVVMLRRAWLESDRALGEAGPKAARQAWRVSRGGTLNSLGYSLFAVGRLDDARRALQGALRDLRPGPAPLAALQDELARAWINLAHLEAHPETHPETHRSRLPQARRLYDRASAHFAQRIAGGQSVAAADRINADLGRARVAVRQLRFADASALFGPAMAELAALTRQGQLQHEPAWLAAWQAMRDAWPRTPPIPVSAATSATPTGAARRGARRAARDPAEFAVEMLVGALSAPPQHAAGLGPEPLLALAEAAATTFSPPSRSPAATAPGGVLAPSATHSGLAEPAAERIAVAYLRFLLAWMADLLTEHDPNWIRTHAAAVEAAIEALRDNAARRIDAAPMLAHWFLATRGLRAQRSALADGDDPALAELRDLLQSLHRIEHEILGERAGEEKGGAGPASVRNAAAYAVASTPGAGGAARAQAWREQSAKVQAARQRLTEGGLLPGALRLEVDQVLALLQPGCALILLARPHPDRLLLIVMVHEPAAAAVVRHGWQPLDADLASFSCATLHSLARTTWGSGTGGAMPEADRFALALFHRLWAQGVEPTLRQLRDRGISAVDLIPSGDLHLVPWNHFADLGPPGRLRLFPSVAAWWRCQGGHSTPPPRHPRWALAAESAPPSMHRLPWVDVESQLSQRLWGAHMQPLALDDAPPGAREADALLGMGHGVPPEVNPARVGLLFGHTVLLPHHLLRLRHCRHALLSACLLGHTDGSRGEALGFLSICFDHRLEFAAGWLTEVPDQAACLFSLAAQWSLKQGYERAAEAHAARGWSDTLAGMRRRLLQGAWPDGLHAWLAREWPAAGGLALPPSPPPSLLRALPWAVALG